MNLLDIPCILEKIYSNSDIETKRNLIKYAEKMSIGNSNDQPLQTIKMIMKRNSTVEALPCVLCMFEVKNKIFRFFNSFFS